MQVTGAMLVHLGGQMEVEQGTLEDGASLASSQHLQGWDEWPRCGAGPG